MKMVFKPAPTLAEFMQSDALARWVMGPVGCLSGDTEYLTPEGWRRIDQYEGGPVAQWVPAGGRLEFVEPSRYIAEDCDRMWYFHNRNSLSMKLTGNHRVPVYDYQGRFTVRTAAELAVRPSRHTIPTTFTAPGKLGLTETEIRLRVAVAADGHYPKQGRQCHITLRKRRKKDRLRWLLTAAGVQFEERVYEKRPTETVFCFPRPEFDKGLTEEWFTASSGELAVLLDEMQHWDGLHDHAELRFSTTKPLEADIMQFAAHAVGWRATIGREDYEGKPWKSVYTVRIARTTKAKVAFRGEVCRDQVLEPRQYCFEVPSSFFLARHDGCVFVTGNSGKTHTCIMEMLRRSAEQAPNPHDGYRYTRWAIVRNTLQQIKTTVLKDIQQVLTPITRFKVSESTIYVHSGDIRSEWLLIPLDSIEDQRRLLSTQLTGAWVNEWREVNPELVTALIGRLGRFPSKIAGGPTWHGLIGDSNPGTMDSPWFEKLELNLPDKWGFFKQPSGLSPEAENVENLPEGYYENLMDGADEDWIAGHVHGEWMPSLAGTAVFRASFDPDAHIKSKLKPIPGTPVCVGLDLGRTPTAVLGQLDWQGRLNVLQEVMGQDTGLEQFLRTQLTPVLMGTRYMRNPIYLCFDPAGMAKSQYTEDDALRIVRRCNLVGVPAPTNEISVRLAAVTKYLLARNGFAIDRDRCPNLIKAMKFQYRYKRKKSGELEDIPEKLHPWSDLADGLQYLALGVHERLAGRAVRVQQSQNKQRPLPDAAWT